MVTTASHPLQDDGQRVENFEIFMIETVDFKYMKVDELKR